MAKPYSASMPDNLDLPSGWKIRFAALSPVDGSVVAGVDVSGAGLIVTNVKGGDLSTDLFEATDLTWLNVPVEGEGE